MQHQNMEQLQLMCQQYVELKDNLDHVQKNVKAHRDTALQLKKKISAVFTENPAIQVPLRDGRTVTAKKTVKLYPLNGDIMGSAIDYAIEYCRGEQGVDLKNCILHTLDNMRANAATTSYTMTVSVPKHFNPTPSRDSPP